MFHTWVKDLVVPEKFNNINLRFDFGLTHDWTPLIRRSWLIKEKLQPFYSHVSRDKQLIWNAERDGRLLGTLFAELWTFHVF